jgi:transposase
MARPAQLTPKMEQVALQKVNEATTARELRSGLSVLIPKRCGCSNAVVSELLGVGIATVVRMQRHIREQADGTVKQKGKWGGRRRQLMSFEEEQAFLEPWIAQSEQGGVLIVPPIHKALEDHLGRTVHLSTMYRLLARHGWRKVEPDAGHPKRDEKTQEAFKKTSPKCWQRA